MNKANTILLLAIAAINTCGAMTKTAPGVAAAAQLLARPIVFINTRIIQDASKGSLEYLDLQKKVEIMQKRGDTNSKKFSDLCDALNGMESKLMKVASDIAKKRGACALLPHIGPDLYVDPSYDITDDAINELNKSYVPSTGIETMAKKTMLPQDRIYEGIIDDMDDYIKEAIVSGANVNYQKAGQPLIYWAVILNKVNAATCLLEHGAKADNSLIQEAIERGNTKSAALIAIKNKVDLNKIYAKSNGTKGTIAQHAADKWDIGSILLLLKNGAKISGSDLRACDSGQSSGLSIIEITTSSGHDDSSFELIKEFIKQGYDINQIWGIHNFGGAYQEPMLSFLIKNGAYPNHIFDQKNRLDTTTWTPLIKATYEGRTGAVITLLASGANINQKASPFNSARPTYPQGPQTALSVAIALGKTDIIKILLEHGATT